MDLKIYKKIKKLKALIFCKITFFLKAILSNLLKMMIAHVSQSISETTCDQTPCYVKKFSCTWKSLNWVIGFHYFEWLSNII